MDQNRGSVLTGNVLAFGIATFCVVALRLGYRAYSRKIGASDWFLVIALISSLCQDAFNAACVTQWGYGHHKNFLSKPIRTSSKPSELLYLNQVFFKVTTMSTKLSILLIYHEIFKRANGILFRATRTVIYGTALFVVGYYSAAFLASIFQCTPVSKSWNSKEPGTCIDLDEFRYYTAAVNIITSVLIIATPLPGLSKMRQTRPEVSELMGLILLGLIHTGCTVARLILMKHPSPLAKTDAQWATINALAVAIVEMDIGIIAASLVVMRPCFQAIRNIFLKKESFYIIPFTSYASEKRSRTDSEMASDKCIVSTTVIELESQRCAAGDKMHGESSKAPFSPL